MSITNIQKYMVYHYKNGRNIMKDWNIERKICKLGSEHTTQFI